MSRWGKGQTVGNRGDKRKGWRGGIRRVKEERKEIKDKDELGRKRGDVY